MFELLNIVDDFTHWHVVESDNPIVFLHLWLLLLFELPEHCIQIILLIYSYSLWVLNLIVSICNLVCNLIPTRLANIYIIIDLLLDKTFFGNKFVPHLVLLLKLIINLSNTLHSQADLMLQSEVYSLRLVDQVRDLISSNFSHPILQTSLKVSAAIHL